MGKQKVRKRVLVQQNIYASKEAFLICETPGCKNAIADWVVLRESTGKVICKRCQLGI